MTSYVIVGAGNFGVATALTLAKRGDVRVTLVDTAPYPNPRAASHDVNKIVRDDYPDKLYMRMLVKAMLRWRHDTLYSPHYREVGVVKRLDFGPAGQCTGVVLETGETLAADRTLVAAGARTPALLAQSAPERKPLHIGDRIVATGAVSFYARLFGEQRDKFAPIPVLKNCLPQVKCEGMAMLDDGTIKFNCDMCFTNYVTFPPTGERMSVAPDQNVFNIWTGPRFLSFFQDRARRTVDGLYGKEVEEIPIDAYRMCWDATTPTHDFLVTPHPHCQGLYVATGGSLHGWKFLPVIGDYIADMMQGSLDPEYADRWAWDKKGGDDGRSANPTYQVVGDLQDWIA